MMNKENEEAIVVMQCAGWKKSCAGTFPSPDDDEKEVRFVANPKAGHKEEEFYAYPDEDSGDGQTWRRKLWHYNKQEKEDNPYRLRQAGCLYKNRVYKKLFEALGAERFFLLSPAWGLVRADFLIPNYDITFSSTSKPANDWANKEAILRDWKNDALFQDCSMLPDETSAPILYIGGIDYQNLFAKLTENLKARRVICYCTKYVPDHLGCDTARFKRGCFTNWQYECAKEFLAGTLEWQK